MGMVNRREADGDGGVFQGLPVIWFTGGEPWVICTMTWTPFSYSKPRRC
jgi:hypothetical protein